MWGPKHVKFDKNQAKPSVVCPESHGIFQTPLQKLTKLFVTLRAGLIFYRRIPIMPIAILWIVISNVRSREAAAKEVERINASVIQFPGHMSYLEG